MHPLPGPALLCRLHRPADGIAEAVPDLIHSLTGSSLTGSQPTGPFIAFSTPRPCDSRLDQAAVAGYAPRQAPSVDRIADPTQGHRRSWQEHMQPDLLTADRLAEVISHAVAPAFLLGAVAGFISILTMRMGGIIDRIRSLNAITEGDTARSPLKADIPRLKRRTRLLNQAVYLALASGICGTLLIMIAFASAFLRRQPRALRGAAVHRLGQPARHVALQVRLRSEDRAARIRSFLSHRLSFSSPANRGGKVS